RYALAQWERAEEEKEEARKQSARAEREEKEARRLKGLADARLTEAEAQGKRARLLVGQMASAVDDIAVNVRGAEAAERPTGNTGTVLLQLACFYSKAATTLRGDHELPKGDRDRLAEQYSVSAVRLLGCAQRVGFFAKDKPDNRDELYKSVDLRPL